MQHKAQSSPSNFTRPDTLNNLFKNLNEKLIGEAQALQKKILQELDTYHTRLWDSVHEQRHIQKMTMANQLQEAANKPIITLKDILELTSVCKNLPQKNLEIDKKGGRLGTILTNIESNCLALEKSLHQKMKAKEDIINSELQIIFHLIGFAAEEKMSQSLHRNKQGFDSFRTGKSYNYHEAEINNLITILINKYLLLDGCDLLIMSSTPDRNALNTLSIKSNAAYIRSGDKLFYVNKREKKCTEIFLTEEKLKEFDQKLEPTNSIKSLSANELDIITSITAPIHVDDLDEEIRFWKEDFSQKISNAGQFFDEEGAMKTTGFYPQFYAVFSQYLKDKIEFDIERYQINSPQEFSETTLDEQMKFFVLRAIIDQVGLHLKIKEKNIIWSHTKNNLEILNLQTRGESLKTFYETNKLQTENLISNWSFSSLTQNKEMVDSNVLIKSLKKSKNDYLKLHLNIEKFKACEHKLINDWRLQIVEAQKALIEQINIFFDAHKLLKNNGVLEKSIKENALLLLSNSKRSDLRDIHNKISNNRIRTSYYTKLGLFTPQPDVNTMERVESMYGMQKRKK